MPSSDPDHAIRRLRGLWRVLLADLLLMAAMPLLLPLLLPKRLAMMTFKVAWWADALVTLGVLVLIPLGYFIRMSIFKRHWVGSQVTEPGYAQGHRTAMMLFWLSGFLSIVTVMLTGRHWPASLGTITAMLVLSINRPQRPIP